MRHSSAIEPPADSQSLEGPLLKRSEWRRRYNLRIGAVDCDNFVWRGGARTGFVPLSDVFAVRNDGLRLRVVTRDGRTLRFRAAQGGPSLVEWQFALAVRADEEVTRASTDERAPHERVANFMEAVIEVHDDGRDDGRIQTYLEEHPADAMELSSAIVHHFGSASPSGLPKVRWSGTLPAPGAPSGWEQLPMVPMRERSLSDHFGPCEQSTRVHRESYELASSGRDKAAGWLSSLARGRRTSSGGGRRSAGRRSSEDPASEPGSRRRAATTPAGAVSPEEPTRERRFTPATAMMAAMTRMRRASAAAAVPASPKASPKRSPRSGGLRSPRSPCNNGGARVALAGEDERRVPVCRLPTAALSCSPSASASNGAAGGSEDEGSFGAAAEAMRPEFTAFLRKWEFRALESDKEAATLKAQNVPLLVRKMIKRITPRRQFVLDEGGSLVMRVKAVSGGWNEFLCVDGWSTHSTLFGYAVSSSMSWKEGVIQTVNTVAGDGKTPPRVTTSLHYVDDNGELVNESIYNGISAKTWFTAVA
jgi:hypothetical protein